ncbi:MAG: tyrosine-type recombinase/integrase [Streptosporangiales bacterium]
MAWVEPHGRYWRVRYYRADGTVGSVSGRYARPQARRVAESMNTDQWRGVFVDPAGGKTTLTEWAERWFDGLELARNTIAQYDSLCANHIEPRFGQVALRSITRPELRAWEAELRTSLASSTVTTTVKVLAMMLEDAVQAGLIRSNPAHRPRRGRRAPARVERQWATPEQVLQLAAGARSLAGDWAYVLIVTLAYTGLRWGEAIGLRRIHVQTNRSLIRVVPEGALTEVDGKFAFADPKTTSGVRDVALPPFLAALLEEHLESHDHELVFVGERGGMLRRSNFSRRVFRPAADGREAKPATRGRVAQAAIPAACPGLTPHGLRHSHNTWLIADGIPEVARARRMGWRVSGAIQEIYSHVAPEVEAQLLDGLELRWRTAARDQPPTVSPMNVESPSPERPGKGL